MEKATNSNGNNGLDLSKFITSAKAMPSPEVKGKVKPLTVKVGDFKSDDVSYEVAGKAYLMFLVNDPNATMDNLSAAVKKFAERSATKIVEGYDKKFFDFYIAGSKRSRSVVTAALYNGDLTQAYAFGLAISTPALAERFAECYKSVTVKATPKLIKKQ